MSAFIEFRPPDDSELWELGLKENWRRLETVLEPLTKKEGATVKSQEGENKLSEIRRDFDTSVCKNKRDGIVAKILWGGDNDEILKKLLSIGLNPDLLENLKKWRPSHLCGLYGRVKCVEAILLCRPSLDATNVNGHTPLQAADPIRNYKCSSEEEGKVQAEALKHRPAIFNSLVQAEKNGFPKLAEMAMKKQWWAVRNLIRRRVITEGEAAEKCNGRNALEWALLQDEMEIAQELIYYFSGVWIMEALKKCEGLETETAAVKAENEGLKKQVSELIDEKKQAESQLGPNFKKQMDDMKEAVTAVVEKVKGITEKDQKINAMEKEMVDHKKLVENESRKIWKEIRSDQQKFKNMEQQLKVMEECHSSRVVGKGQGDRSEVNSEGGLMSKKHKAASPISGTQAKRARTENSDYRQSVLSPNTSHDDDLPNMEPPSRTVADLPVPKKKLDPVKMYEDLLKLNMDHEEAWNAVMKILTMASKKQE